MNDCTVCYIEKEDEILMLYRNKKENDINKGKWIGVGGHIEKFESPYECAIREVKEETGLDVKNLIARGFITFIDNGEKMNIYVFSTTEFEGELIECNEGELHWIKRNEILKLNIWKTDIYMLNKIINKDYKYFMIKAIYEDSKYLKKEIIEIE